MKTETTTSRIEIAINHYEDANGTPEEFGIIDDRTSTALEAYIAEQYPTARVSVIFDDSVQGHAVYAPEEIQEDVEFSVEHFFTQKWEGIVFAGMVWLPNGGLG